MHNSLNGWAMMNGTQPMFVKDRWVGYPWR